MDGEAREALGECAGAPPPRLIGDIGRESCGPDALPILWVTACKEWMASMRGESGKAGDRSDRDEADGL